jgi:GTP-binding protein EngB required for normal cell division
VTTNALDPQLVSTVPQRLAALAELTRIGQDRRDGFDSGLLADAEQLLRRSGERMRMSGTHTVVALAGGTGSGKSSLFNALSGATFSPVGVTRPTTRHTHACVWGMEGAAALLDWLSVQRRHRYARASALDEGETGMHGLLLLDLPDHDSVVSGSAALVDRLVKLADLLIWVLDPLKYADASVHKRYLVPLAGHAAVTTVVLNQCDTLDAQQISDCTEDLRRLLDAEGLLDTHIVVTSATTEVGLDELRMVLADAVASRRAANDRISSDIDALLDRFTVYAGDSLPGVRVNETVAAAKEEPDPSPAGPPWEHWDDDQSGTDTARSPARPPWEEDGADNWNPWETPAAPVPQATSRPPWEDAATEEEPAPDPVSFVPVGPAASLAASFEKAVGVTAIAEGLHSARERTAARYVGWPPARLAARLRGQGAVGKQREETDAPKAQRSDIDNAVTLFAHEVSGSLPEPWSGTVRTAARSRAAQAPEALGAAVAKGMPNRAKVTGWWRLTALAQWLLVLLVLAGAAWIVVIIAGHAAHKHGSALGDDLSLIPWLAVMVVALLLLGSLVSSWCQNMVVLAADRERIEAIREIRTRIAAVTRDTVLLPAGTELAAYERFRSELAAARQSR